MLKAVFVKEGLKTGSADSWNPHMKVTIKLSSLLLLALLIVGSVLSMHGSSAQSPARVKSGSDWADWRGPTRDGISLDKNLPVKWSPQGENLLWKAPYGGRSTPIIMNGRLFLFNSAGEGET